MDVLKKRSADANFPRVVLVHMGAEDKAQEFFEKRWASVPAIQDEQKVLYRDFALEQGSLLQVLGPRALWAGIKGLVQGHGVGKPEGDPMMMSGRFLIHGERILWQDIHEHAGAGTEYREMIEVYESLAMA